MGIADFLRKLGGGDEKKKSPELLAYEEQSRRIQLTKDTAEIRKAKQEGITRRERFQKKTEPAYKVGRSIKKFAREYRKQPSSFSKFIKRPYVQRKKGVYSAGGVAYRVPLRPYQAQGKGPGRPKQSYKLRTNPLTGKQQFIPAQAYYSLQRKAKSMQSQRIDYSQMRRQQEMMSRGMTPQQIQQVEMMRQARQQQQMQMQGQMPQQQPQQIRLSQMPQQMRMRQMQMRNQVQQYPVRQVVETSFFTGQKFIKQIGRPRERWLL